MTKVKVNDREYVVERDKHKALINKMPIQYDILKINDHEYHLIVNGKSTLIKVLQVDLENQVLNLEINSKEFKSHLVSTVEETIEHMASKGNMSNIQKEIRSPMPGLIQKVFCKVDQEIKKGDHLIVLNAMKMENVIKAHEEGKVISINVDEGEQVEKGKVLIQF